MCLGAFGARSPSPAASSRAPQAGPRGACGFGGEDNLVSLCVPRNLGELPSDYQLGKPVLGVESPKAPRGLMPPAGPGASLASDAPQGASLGPGRWAGGRARAPGPGRGVGGHPLLVIAWALA